MTLTLQGAISLATEAHKNQWRNPINPSLKQYAELRTLKELITKADSRYKFKADDKLILMDKSICIFDGNVWNIKEPYITHPLAVMDMMDTDEEKIVAVLHDLLEDTNITTAYLKHNGLPTHLINSLEWLTHIKGESYEDYIKNISCCSLATKVKIADITCNLLDNPSKHAKQKYAKAMPILLASI